MFCSWIDSKLLGWNGRNFPFVVKREGRFITLYKYNLKSIEGDILLEDIEPKYIFSRQFSEDMSEDYLGDILTTFNKVVTKIKNND